MNRGQQKNLQKRRKSRRPAIRRLDSLRFPLVFSIKSGEESQTTIASLQEVFDRTRTFRISSIHGEFNAIKYPALIQVELFGVASSTDNTWTSPALNISTGVRRTFNYRIPATVTGWFPSGAVATWPLLRVSNICYDKNLVNSIIGTINLTIVMRPRELDKSCPTIHYGTPTVSSTSTSFSNLEITE